MISLTLCSPVTRFKHDGPPSQAHNTVANSLLQFASFAPRCLIADTKHRQQDFTWGQLGRRGLRKVSCSSHSHSFVFSFGGQILVMWSLNVFQDYSRCWWNGHSLPAVIPMWQSVTLLSCIVYFIKKTSSNFALRHLKQIHSGLMIYRAFYISFSPKPCGSNSGWANHGLWWQNELWSCCFPISSLLSPLSSLLLLSSLASFHLLLPSF